MIYSMNMICLFGVQAARQTLDPAKNSDGIIEAGPNVPTEDWLLGEGAVHNLLNGQSAIIIDGEVLQNDYWVELNPRVCIGQSDKYEMLLLVIEGRLYTEGILGTDVNECAKILQRHNAVQAMNVDGGTSAMMWYDGEYVIRGSNAATRYTGSRPVPNAFVYHKVEE